MRSRWIDESLISIKGDRARIVSTGSNEIKVTVKRERAKFDSKLELAYDQYLAALKFAGEITDFHYHGVVFMIPGGQKYTPDFLVHTKQGNPEIHECKGSLKMKNARDGITRLKVAAGTFKCFDFKLVYRRKGQWEIVSI